MADLKRDGKHANNDIGQGEIGDKQIGDRLHLPGVGHNPDDQGVSDYGQHAYASVEQRQDYQNGNRNLVNVICRIMK